MPRYCKALYIALRELCKFLSVYEGKKSLVEQKHFLPQFRLINRSVSCEVRKVERAGPKLLKVLGLSSYIDSYCFVVIASSPSPAPLLGPAYALGAFRATPGTPHLGLLPLGRALCSSSPLTGNLIKMCNNVTL
jgi:hypothetical protein